MMRTVCWYYDVTELEREARFSAALELIPWEERRKKVLRFVHRKDQLLSLGAGLLMWQALLQAGATNLDLEFAPSGKPFLRQHPHLHFNISHSGSLAVCAVSDAPIGVDVEYIAPIDAAVAAFCLSSDEQDYLRRASDPERTFCELWTRKESCLKLLGCGLDAPLSQMSTLFGHPWSFAKLELPKAMISVCTERSISVEFRPFSYFDGSTDTP